MSRRKKLLPWFCVVLAPLLLLGTDHLLRIRERHLFQAYTLESTRRGIVGGQFRGVLYMAHMSESPDGIAKELTALGTVSQSHTNGIWNYQFTNKSTGDLGEITFTKSCVEGTIEYHPFIVRQTKTWAIFSGTCIIWGWMTSALLLLGFAVFFLPRHQRPCALVVATLGALASQLSPDPTKWFAVTYMSAPPLWTLGLVLGATVLRRRRKNPGICAKCKYDLTGNLSGICPECGTPLPVPPPPPPKMPNLDAMAGNLDLIE